MDRFPAMATTSPILKTITVWPHVARKWWRRGIICDVWVYPLPQCNTLTLWDGHFGTTDISGLVKDSEDWKRWVSLFVLLPSKAVEDWLRKISKVLVTVAEWIVFVSLCFRGLSRNCSKSYKMCNYDGVILLRSLIDRRSIIYLLNHWIYNHLLFVHHFLIAL